MQPTESQPIFRPSLIPTVLPQGNGEYLVKPGRPVFEVRPKQAAKMLGVCKTTVYQWLQQGLLTYRKASKKVILIPAEAVEDLRKKTEDPEFWQKQSSPNGAGNGGARPHPDSKA